MDRKIEVLLVEDVPLAAKMAEIILSGVNCCVTVSPTGKDAIEKFKRHQYSLVFMDLGLPDMDGVSVTKAFRKIEENHAHTPIIILTAHNTDESRQNSLTAGADDFLAKPLTANSAQEMIEKYILHKNKKAHFKR